ncbi:hypothetical protein CIHG_00026 [Coccidioides immitis H538.4]|uniref:RlpA-like protein double-psi beta-barrel domain-containing protein n=1 Tax=Coccidioides immitis H538.4 TaxID=396776 RepID=A0A0J8RAP6_COCIT|nr:hypothetical protein CIHG_00026 [Coccidioides immitis H538.4]
MLFSRLGKGTIYQQLGASGSCGRKLGDDAMIVALSNAWMKGQPNAPLCGRKVKATNKKNGKTVVVTVADTCAGCGAMTSISRSEHGMLLPTTLPGERFPPPGILYKCTSQPVNKLASAARVPARRLFTPSRAQLRSHSTA